jgi:hypothetical protein
MTEEAHKLAMMVSELQEPHITQRHPSASHMPKRMDEEVTLN